MIEQIQALITAAGISGLIALIITGAICIRYVKHGFEKIPEILNFALAAIIGFYFGAATVHSGRAQSTSPAITTTAPK
jgi:uncharacterized membrane protein YfcA